MKNSYFLIKVEKVLPARTNLMFHFYYGFISAIQIEMSVSGVRRNVCLE